MEDKEIGEGMFVLDECIPFKVFQQKLEELGYRVVSITETQLHKKGDLAIIEELKKLKDVIFVTTDSRMSWKCTLNRVPCVYLSVEGALLEIFIKHVKMYGDSKMKVKE